MFDVDDEEVAVIYICMMALKGLTQAMKELAHLNQYVGSASTSEVVYYQFEKVFCQKIENLIKDKVEKKTGVHRFKFLHYYSSSAFFKLVLVAGCSFSGFF